MKNEQLPLARIDQLIVKEVDDEVLVYDLKTDKAHCLNKTAANVWKNCDGEKSVSDITAALASGAAAAVDEGVVWLALEQLEKFELLAKVPTASTVFGGLGRRQLMRTLGVAAIALPVVVSIIAPIAASAASACGQSCNSAADCVGIPGCTTCGGSPKVCK
jgi:hypothetical protein